MKDGDDLLDDLERQGIAKMWADAKAKRARPREAAASRPKKRAAPERDAQRVVVQWLRLHGCIVSAMFTEQRGESHDAVARARFGAMRKAFGATAGFPDLVVCLSNGRGVVFIEMKSSVGRLSQAQLGIHAWLEAHGHIVVVGTSVDTVQAALLAKGVVIGPARLRMAVPVAPL